MRNDLWRVSEIVIIASASLAIPLRLAAADKPAQPTYISFDAPGAGTGSNQGTLPYAINPSGAITGFKIDSDGQSHCFVRKPDGTLSIFDPPGAVNGTLPGGINPDGAITGEFADANHIFHGFLRSRDGAFTIIDLPGAVNGTFPAAINPAGAITGYYTDANYTSHSFLRTPDGTFTTFDFPGSVYGTLAFGINPAGAIAGVYVSASFGLAGFLRAHDGSFTSFDPAGSSFVFPAAISNDGTIAGIYFQPIAGNPAGGYSRGFLWTRDGGDSTFDATAPSPCCVSTYPNAINAEGTITGEYSDAQNLRHGFIRMRNGTITTFDAPGAGTKSLQGTISVGINPAGVITGSYIDANNVSHGFIRIPPEE